MEPRSDPAHACDFLERLNEKLGESPLTVLI
jgi:hypothetical protein